VLPKLMELKSLFLSILQETQIQKVQTEAAYALFHSENKSKERNTNKDLPPHEGSSSSIRSSF
jgi:hypothetical protein